MSKPFVQVAPGSSNHRDVPAPALLASSVGSCGDLVIELQPRNRLRAPASTEVEVLLVRDGLLALEATPPGGRRQILDFLLPGDSLPASVACGQPAFFLRAVTESKLVRLRFGADGSGLDEAARAARPIDHLRRHLQRRNLHQIMIGQLDTASRVAAFLLVLILRINGALPQTTPLALPMSRDDIADYLAINPDTLSRVMMRMEMQGLLRRINRHSIVVLDTAGLGQHTPLKPAFLQSLVGTRPRAGYGADPRDV